MVGEIVEKFNELGIDPKLLHQFLKENILISEQINEDLIQESSPISHARNNMMFAQVKLLIAMMDEYYQRQGMKF